MQSRGTAFTTFLLLAAAITTVPIALLFSAVALDTYNTGGRFNGGLAGLDRTYVPNDLNSLSMAQDRFQGARLLGSRQQDRISLTSIDPESRAMAPTWQQFPVVGNSTPLENGWSNVFGDTERLWVITHFDRVFEKRGEGMVELAVMPADAVTPPGFWRDWNDCRVFVSNGTLCCITMMPNMEHELFQLVDNKWVSLGELRLLDANHSWWSDDLRELLSEDNQRMRREFQSKGATAALFNFNRARFSVLGTIEILPIGPELHLFWRLPDRILYRRGVELVPSSFQNGPTASERNRIASALDPENGESIAHGWNLVSDGLDGNTELYRLKVGGEPAIVLVDRSTPQAQRAKALRIEDGKWTEFAATELPLLSDVVAVGSRDNGSMAYIATATHLGRTRVLALEPTGFRLTLFEQFNWLRGVAGYVFVASYFVFSLAMGAILAIVTWLLMWHDSGRYGFGLQEVQLASLLERGAARILDLLLMGLATAGTVLVLNKIVQPDWLTFLEGMQQFDEHNMRQPRLDLLPVMVALRIIAAGLFVLIASWLVLVVTQGRYGMTPGKWVCGLRTVRTSLRPCGFAHSLFRELMMYIDSLDLICWTPGILSIAFSPNRQRLGDRLADTIVVRRTR